MTREEIEKEIAQLKQQREIAIINVHRLDGAIAAFELMLNKTQATENADSQNEKQ